MLQLAQPHPQHGAAPELWPCHLLPTLRGASSSCFRSTRGQSSRLDREPLPAPQSTFALVAQPGTLNAAVRSALVAARKLVVMDTSQPGPGFDATELAFRRLVRAEHMLAAQRARVRQLEYGGFDVARPRALLRLMEAITSQFRTTCRLLRAYQAPHRSGVSPAPPTLPTRSLGSRGPSGFSCPHCGLPLALSHEGNGALVYEIDRWLRQCQHRALETPVLCQLIPSSAAAMH
jgi:hypothetical protein